MEEQHKFKAEIQQLLNILVHSLYTDREIFVRELISNAADALNRLQFEMLTARKILDPEVELAIRISVDKEAHTITVSDTGVGMTRNELIQNLGTIAQSGAAAFVSRLQELDQAERPSLEMIGQFGVGFYSAFIVAEEVRVASRSYLLDAEACEWVADGSDSFRVGPVPEGKHDRGTEITVKLKEDASEFAEEWRLRQIIKKHSDYVSFPIYVGDDVVNRQKSPWRQAPQDTGEEEYEEFYKHLTLDFEKPLLASHLVTDAPVDIRSILYVPSRREKGPLSQSTDHGLRLYAKGVMIQEYNKDLLPNYLRFVEGVMESEDLPLNVSRETVQRNPTARRIQKALVNRLIRELETLARVQPDDYNHFWDEFGVFVKEGIATEPANKGDLLPLLRFRCSDKEHTGGTSEGLVSLAEYVESMSPDQQAVYYLLGEDVESVAQSPHLDYFRANGINVLFLVDPIDGFMIAALDEFEGRPLRNVDDASLDLPQEPDESTASEVIPQAEFNRLVTRFTKVLGDRVAEVRDSKVLRDSPCRLVAPESVPGQEVQRVMQLLNRETEVPAKILEINQRHALIQNLSRLANDTPEDPVIDPAIEQLFENQLLIEGQHPNVADMVSRIQTLLEAATATGS